MTKLSKVKISVFDCGESKFSYNYGNAEKSSKNHSPETYIFAKKCVGKIKHFSFDYVQELLTA